jgi:hypothetical protein
MFIFRIFSRGYSRRISFDYDIQPIYKKVLKPSKDKTSKDDKKRIQGSSNIFCDHVSESINDNITYFYKYIYPTRR